jgi:hypothetical protein
MGPDDNTTIVVDQRNQIKYGAPARNVAVLRVGEKYQEMPFRTGVFHAAYDS